MRWRRDVRRFRYDRERRALYEGLKLHGLREAPVILAAYCDDGTEIGRRLGAETMPEMRRRRSLDSDPSILCDRSCGSAVAKCAKSGSKGKGDGDLVEARANRRGEG